MIDEIPALAVAAAFADGVTEIRDAAELVVKESNRIGDAARGARQARCRASRPGPTGWSCAAGAPRPATFDSHGDHRIAMAMAVAANAIAGGIDGAGLARGRVVVSGVRGASRAADRIRRPMTPVTIVVAIDGPSGSGKSTVARAVAAELGLPVLDTGAMYRAVTLAALEAGAALDDASAVRGHRARRARSPSRDGVTMLDGRDVSGEIRGPLVTGAVSIVSAHPEVRLILVAQQRVGIARHGGGVVEGRDIGTVVFPDATVKVFLVPAHR